MHVRTESPFLGDKLDVRMTLTVEEAEGGAACRQVGRRAVPGDLERWGACSTLWMRLRLLEERQQSAAGCRAHRSPAAPAAHPPSQRSAAPTVWPQVLEGHIRVKMFGVGRIIEGIVKDSLHNVSERGSRAGGLGRRRWCPLLLLQGSCSPSTRPAASGAAPTPTACAALAHTRHPMPPRPQ